jgi:23S rRNA (uracil1939-C5)-methyltransferase
MGNFSIPLVLQGADVTGVELNKNAIAAAQKNAKNAKIHAGGFIAADVTRYLRQLVNKQSHFELVLLDPPRRGLGQASGLLSQIDAETILYISCEPSTLARDLKTLIKKYRLLSVTPVDMFPHTHHIECVAVLEKN